MTTTEQGQQQIRADLVAEQELDMNAGFAKTHSPLNETDNILDAGLNGIREEFRGLRAGHRQLMIANWTIGGIIYTLVGVIWLLAIF